MVVPGNQHINSNVCILPCQNRHIMDMDCPFPVQSIPGGLPFLPFRFLLVGRGGAFTSPESFVDIIQLHFHPEDEGVPLR